MFRIEGQWHRLQSVPIEPQQQYSKSDFEGNDGYEDFAATVLGSNNQMWSKAFEANNKTYTEPTLVLFRTSTRSACGVVTSEVGPNYCPLDQTVYLDETFFDELTNRFGAKGGDVAQAYVMSHEVGHHAQNELGIMDKVDSAAQKNPDQANALSVKLELQADCFAGLWANSLKDKQVFEPGEIEEAMDAAQAVGDDRIQEKVNGYVNPEEWTHGSAQQRRDWFTKGYNSGQLSACEINE
jgi:predicted metalloprotease